MLNSTIEHYDDRDYILWWDSLKPISPQIKEGRMRYLTTHQYNQNLIDRYSCTTHASVWVISDFLWQKLSQDFIKKVLERQKKTWFRSWIWDKFSNWIKQAIKEHNANPDIENWLEYFRVKLTEENIKSVISGVWSSIVAWYKGSLRADAEDNGIIDNIDNRDGYWHCIRIVKWFYEDNKFKIKYIDNYYWVVKHNIITVDDFLANKDFFKYWYFVKPKKV